MSKLLGLVDGYKSYIILVGIGILMAITHGEANGLNMAELFRDPELLLKELLVALGGSTRSALSKLGK